MYNFKTFIREYLTQEQHDRFKHVEMSSKARADTDHVFGEGNDVVKGHVDSDAPSHKSEVHKQVEHHLGHDLSHDEYRTGLIKDRYGRDTKIGKRIQDTSLRNDYASDKMREGSQMKGGFATSTVRGTLVAGQTNSVPDANHPKGHSWGELSCKNVDSGNKKSFLEHEIKHGTVVHFVHDHTGQEIYRATLQPFHNTHGDVAYSVDSEYGVTHPSFTKSAHDMAKKLSGHFKPGVFKRHAEVYNDSGATHMLHPMASAEDVTHHMKSDDFAVRMAALRHENANASHVDAGITDVNRNVRREAVKSPHLTAEHISKVLSNPNENSRVRMDVLNHPNVTRSHIQQALEDSNANVREMAASHKLNK